MNKLVVAAEHASVTDRMIDTCITAIDKAEKDSTTRESECCIAFGEARDAVESLRAIAPAPPPECQTEAEKKAFAFGWWSALEAVNKRESFAWLGVHVYEMLRAGHPVTTTITKHRAFLDDVAIYTNPQGNVK